MKMVSIIFLSIALFTPGIADAEENPPSPHQLDKFQEDVTGNSKDELIKLSGIPFTTDSDYFSDIWLTVSDGSEQIWEIPYEGGYEPDILFYDLNHDGVKDIFYQSSQGGSGGLHHYHLHTIKNQQQLEEISLPVQKNIQAKFRDNFKIDVQIDYEQGPITVDVTNRSSEYVRLGIYDDNGKLIENTTPMIAPIASFEPVEISDRKGYGLKSTQLISGAYQADELGTVETLWYYEKDRWIILKTEWLAS